VVFVAGPFKAFCLFKGAGVDEAWNVSAWRWTDGIPRGQAAIVPFDYR